jgi:hypothetical protein
MQKLSVFDAQPRRLIGELRRSRYNLVKKTVLFLVCKVNDQRVQEFAEQRFDFLRLRLRARKHRVNAAQLFSKSGVFVNDRVENFRPVLNCVHGDAPKGTARFTTSSSRANASAGLWVEQLANGVPVRLVGWPIIHCIELGLLHGTCEMIDETGSRFHQQKGAL